MKTEVIDYAKKALLNIDNIVIADDDVLVLHDAIVLYKASNDKVRSKNDLLNFKYQKASNYNFYRVKGHCSVTTYTEFFDMFYKPESYPVPINDVIKAFFEKSKEYEQFSSYSLSENNDLSLESLIIPSHTKTKKRILAEFNYSTRTMEAAARRHFSLHKRAKTSSVISSHLDLMLKDDEFVPALTVYVPLIADLKFSFCFDLNVGMSQEELDTLIENYELALRETIFEFISSYNKKINFRSKKQEKELVTDEIKNMSCSELVDYLTVIEMIHY